jgi:hypothetical protein
MYPHERSLVERFQSKPFALLGINSDRDRKGLKSVVADEDITWRSWWDGGSTEGLIASTWNVTTWPTIYVLDHKGVIRYRDLREEALDKAIDTLFAELDRDPEAREKAARAAESATPKKPRLRLEPRMSIPVGKSRIASIALDSAGKILVTGGWEEASLLDPNWEAWKAGNTKGQLRTWDALSGKELATFVGDFGALFNVAISHDAKTIATAGRLLKSPDEGELRLWDFDKRESRTTLRGHTGFVLSVAFSPNGNLLASGGSDRTVRIWNPTSNEQLALLKHPSSPRSLCFSSNGKILVAGCDDGTGVIQLWETATWRERQSFKVKGFHISSVALSQDGKLLAAGGAMAGSTEGEVFVWDLESGTKPTKLHRKSFVSCVAFSHDSKSILGGCHVSAIWDTGTWKEVAVIPRKFTSSDDKFLFSADGQTLITTDHPGIVSFWDLSRLRATSAQQPKE